MNSKNSVVGLNQWTEKGIEKMEEQVKNVQLLEPADGHVGEYKTYSATSWKIEKEIKLAKKIYSHQNGQFW